MSYDMQASGFNSVGSVTLIYANFGWSEAPQTPVLWVAAGAPTTPGVGEGTNKNLDAVLARGNLLGNGLVGWGGYAAGSGSGTGVVGVPGAADFDVIGARGKNIGVYGAGAGSSPAIGVLGEGGSGSPGVVGRGGGGPDPSPVSPAGVHGQAGAGNANGVEGRGSGNFAGVAGFGDVTSSANSGIGVFAVGGAPQPGSGHSGGPGVYAVGNGGPGYVQINQPLGVYGVGGGDNAPGICGVGSGGPAFAAVGHAAGVYGVGGAGGAPGVLGQGGSSFGNGVQGLSDLGVGVFAAGHTGVFASTSAPNGLAGQFSGDVFIGGNLTVTGKAKSVAVPFPDGSHRRLYCVESPENWFEDFGFGELSNGQAQVQLEQGFRSVVDSDVYHVFITEYEDNNALYVAERSSTGFLVRAKASQANGRFSYRVVAKRKDHVAPRFDKVELPPDPPTSKLPIDLANSSTITA